MSFLLLASMTSSTLAQPAASVSSNELCVMTYNLRYASDTPPNAWPARRPLMRELILQAHPDVMGTQEGLTAQLADLASDLPDYGWIGEGREGGKRGEYAAVFYLKSRLEPLDSGHFWLSDTPEKVGSITWGTSLPRMVTWVKFRDRLAQREFYFFNTHFDNAVAAAREKSATLVRQRIAALKTDLPVLLVGDFNAGAGREAAYDILTKDGYFKDTWQTASERQGEGLGTFNDFKEVPHDGERIDRILTRGAVTADRIEILTFSRDGQFPSDHCPVRAQLYWGVAK